ncbi:Arm DNA-binding domain-containing protein [Tabrizicola sp.]|uniref:Arm DNA-binding domain-containing protein n=1 Tax=Tabrizicola sp. TaxID=2005166 RepID=UPI003F2CE462
MAFRRVGPQPNAHWARCCKRSYVLQYRVPVRSRRYTIGPHGVWTPEPARKEALVQLARVAKGENPAEEREQDHTAIAMKQL